MKNTIKELIDVALRDDLVTLRKILKDKNPDLESDVIVGEEYELDEPDEIPLLFFLIMHGISIDALEVLVENGLDILKTNREGLGAVDIAIKYRRPDIVKLCKDRGLDLNLSRRKSGMTPLMLASAFNDVDMVKYLIEEGADINSVDKYGMTALDYARKMGQGRVKDFLENIGAKNKFYKD